MGAVGKDLTEGSVFKQLIMFSVPFFLSQVLQALYSIADMFIVGKFMGDYGISAINNSSSVIMLITMLISGFSLSGTVLVAQYIGAKQKEEASKAIGTLFTIFIYVSIIFTFVGILLRGTILSILNTPKEAVLEAKNYITICFSGTIFICGYNAVSAILRGTGDSKRPLYFVAVATVINVVLDLIFVGVFNWGAGGAAFATVLAQAFSFILAVNTLHKSGFIFDFKLKSFKIDVSKLKLIVKIGIPSAVQSTIVNFSILFVISSVNAYGLAASTAAGIGAKIDSFATLPTIAVGQSVSSMVGQNLGAEKIDRAKKTYFSGLILSGIFGIIIFTFVNLEGNMLFKAFGCSDETLEIGRLYIKYCSFAYLANSVAFVSNGLATGSGNAIFAMCSAITSVILARIPLIFLFEKILGFGLKGIFMAFGMGQYFGMIVGILFFLSGKWKRIIIKESPKGKKEGVLQ